MSETFKVAGVSRLNGQVKVRFANDLTRVKTLAKGGHTDIELVELPSEMTKEQVVVFLKTTELYKNPEYQAVIDAADAKYNPAPKAEKAPRVKAEKPAKAPKAEKTVKVTKGKGKPSLEAIKARASKKTTASAAEAADTPATPQEAFQAAVDAVGDEAPF